MWKLDGVGDRCVAKWMKEGRDQHSLFRSNRRAKRLKCVRKIFYNSHHIFQIDTLFCEVLKHETQCKKTLNAFQILFRKLVLYTKCFGRESVRLDPLSFVNLLVLIFVTSGRDSLRWALSKRVENLYKSQLRNKNGSKRCNS